MAGLIGLDWGTSSLRATLFDDGGSVLETRHRPHGIRALPSGGFDAALAEITRGWPASPRLASGMVGARGGWMEMPYLDLPVDVQAVGRSLGSVQAADGSPVHLVPGLRDATRPDVMRGEETQILGALTLDPSLSMHATLLLPGTHSKWVDVRDGRIVAFRTAMTGELYALLLAHSILGAGVATADPAGHADSIDTDIFRRGVRAAAESGAAGALSRIFSIRASMLSGALGAHEIPDFLSGLLIGEEVRAAMVANESESPCPLRLIGDPALCTRYLDALDVFAIEASVCEGDAAAQGLWRIACSAGLVEASTSSTDRLGVAS